MMVSRRALLTGMAGAAVAAVAGCGTSNRSAGGPSNSGSPSSGTAGARPVATGKPTPTVRPIGDGSTQDTGPQPRQPKAERLAPGQQPPQFVVMSWDGAGETAAKLFTRFRDLSTELKGSMTFFLTGIYTLPEHKRTVYKPPRHPVGTSAIGYLSDNSVHATIEQVGIAWREGHEIGTHFNGHFCGAGGVKDWSPADWDSEIEQAIGMVSGWRTNTGFTDLAPLPFDYRQELVGGRTPCLEGRTNMRKSQHARRFRYDSSGTGVQKWPTTLAHGMWDLPMQQIPFPGHSFEVLAMDYNMMYNQSGVPNGDPGMRAKWRTQARDAFLGGFRRAYGSNRAPLIIGNHFERWNGGIYMDAVADAARQMAAHDDVRFVSFRQLVDWIEAQDPATLRKLQKLEVGQKPAGGWAEYLGK